MIHDTVLGWDKTYHYIAIRPTEGMQDWLDNHESDGVYSVGGHGFYFELEEDAAYFALRWT